MPSPIDRVPAPILFIIGAITQYIGASMAVDLFDRVPPQTVAWVRAGGAALVLLVITRPWRQRWSMPELAAAGVFGVVSVAMNTCFYLAVDRLPLGNTVAIEFAGPVAVAAFSVRNVRTGLSLVTVASGVVLLAGIELGGNATGVAFALGAAVFWAGYIVLGSRLAAYSRRVTGLAVALTIGTVAMSPIGLIGSRPMLVSPGLLVIGATVGVLSTAIPYGLDQFVLTRLAPGAFASLLALLPVTASIMGFIALGQRPGALDALGIALVVAGLAWRGMSDRVASSATATVT